MKNKYIYAYSPEDAKIKAGQLKKSGYNIVGIEAEWGNRDLKNIYPEADNSLSHHGVFSNQPAPCMRWDLRGKYNKNTAFIFSHFDLDSIFGCWLLEGRLQDTPDMHQITEHIAWCDVNGGHRAHEDYDNYFRWGALISKISYFLKKLKKEKFRGPDIISRLYEFFILSYDNYDINEASKKYEKANQEAYNALDKTYSVLNKLHVFMAYTNFLNRYYIEHQDFVSISEVNILYDTKKKRVSIATYDESTAIKYFGENGVLTPLQKYFGDESGGRVSVGGSPKNQEVSFTSFIKFVKEIKEKVCLG